MDKVITKSASKLTLLLIVGTLCAITLFSVFVTVWRGTLDGKEILALFATSVSLVIGYYFGRATAPTVPEVSATPVDPNIG